MKKIIQLFLRLSLVVVLFSLIHTEAKVPEVEKLIQEQKYSEALKKVQELISEQKKNKNDLQWAELIVQEAKLKIGLHGYETAVKDLRAYEWPKSAIAHAMVALTYARSLQAYHEAYSWEIRKREKITGGDKFELKNLTSEEIYHEAYGSLEKAWKVREELGKVPKTTLPEVIGANSYPAEVRATLRDTLTYLISDFLSDTNGWTTEESNSTYTLKAKELLAKGGQVSLLDKNVHPVKKISYVLHDLAEWNKNAGKKESSLEATLEIHRKMSEHFKSKTAELEIKSSLENILKSNKSNEWVTMGYGLMANFVQRYDEDFVKALAWAKKGSDLYPKSLGAKMCRDIITQIEQPFLSIEGMNVDGVAKKSALIKYKNIRKAYFKSYKIDFKKFIESSKDYSLRPGWRELDTYLKEKPFMEWNSDLLETKDYKNHNFFVTPPKHSPGFYLIFASSSQSFTNATVQGVELFFSDYIFQVTSDPRKEEFLVQVLRGDNGNPVKDAKVSFYNADYQKGHKLIDDQKSDKNGFTRFKAKGFTNRSFFFIAEKDGHIIGSKNQAYLYGESGSGSERKDAFIYTDRSIYRPEQKILWKIIAYKGLKKFELHPKQDVEVVLRDANYEIVHKVTVRTNSYGSGSGEFLIPKGKLLGNWSMSTSYGGNASLKVEEYKRPTFIVEFDDKGNELRLNKEASIKGNAKYYFGLPVTKGTAKWKVTRQAVLPWWCFWGYFNWGSIQNAQFLTSGSSPLKEDGSFVVKFTPKADEDASDISDINYNYAVDVDVTDEGGETQSAKVSNTIGFSSVKATFSQEEDFILAKQKSEIVIKRMDLNGRALAGKGQWKLVKLILPKTTLSPADIPVPKELKKLAKDKMFFPDDLSNARWNPKYGPDKYLREWEEGETIKTGDTSHAQNGNATVALPPLDEGAYRLRFETKDQGGVTYKDQKEFLVTAPTTTFPLPGLMLVQNSSLEVGGTLRVLLTSGFPNQRIVFEIFRAGKSVEQKVLFAGKDKSLIEIPIKEEDRGGFTIIANLVTDYQDIQFNQNVIVPWSNKLVDVTYSTMRDKIRPGSNETFTVSIQGKNGRKIGTEAFELLAYMYDKSLDSMTPHNYPSPINIFPSGYGANFPQTELGQGTTVHTNIHYPYKGNEFSHLGVDHWIYYPSYGIGGPGSRGSGGFEGMRMKGGIAAPMAMNDMAMESSIPASAPSLKKASRAEPQLSELAKEKEAESTPTTEIRTNFSETAFWKPNLIPGKDGKVSFEFKVPDSVTSWSVWAHAISKDLQSGHVSSETKTIKELMVRPYLPRFFREGDEAEIKIVVNNSSEKDIDGIATFEILDETEKKSLASEFGLTKNELKFSVKAQGSTNVSVKLKVPAGIKNVVVKAIAKSGKFSDGEVRPLPILPGRMHLAQSKFVTLINKDKAELTFPDLQSSSDKTLINDLFVVTLDAQLFYSVLSSLPYLVKFPYESTEMMLNAFVSSGIVSSVFKDFPEVGKMARSLSERKTRLEKWDDEDPNRKIALEEAPWLSAARGNDAGEDAELMTILHPDIAKNTRNKFLKSLKNAQTGTGGFPWFPGGPPSPYITLSVLYGFSKAIEFGVDVPKDMTISAWAYLHSHYINEIVKDLMRHNVGWELVTFLNYVLSNYPDTSWSGNVFTEAERKTMLNFSFKHWKNHSPYLKSYLAMTLTRAKRTQDAKLVWDSVMDSAKTSKDEGTHWAQEDRSWLWYNDTIETHALALRTGSELGTKREQLDGMVHWLFLNKKLNQWKSTRATAEVIYSLTHYLKKTKQLGIKESMTVNLGGETKKFDFNPDKYTGKKNQIVYKDQEVSAKLLPVKIEKTTDGLAFASATWHYSTEKLPTEAVGDFLKVNRKFFKREADKSGVKLIPITNGSGISVGDEVEVHISLSSKHPVGYVHLRDPRAAGFEPVDKTSSHKWEFGLYWYEEIRDNGTNFFFEQLPQGQYTFKYRIRASTAGKFRAGPATIQPLYAPEFVGFSEGHELTIKQQK